MGTTEVAAWLGAVTGVSGILWDIYKWKTAGPRLTASATPNMEVLGDTCRDKGTKYISVRVRNTGTAKTTLTTLAVATYESWWKRRKLMATASGVVPNPLPGQDLPFRLDVGEEWTGLIRQTGPAQEMMDTGKMYCDIYHSWSKRPVHTKVAVRQKDDSAKDQ